MSSADPATASTALKTRQAGLGRLGGGLKRLFGMAVAG